MTHAPHLIIIERWTPHRRGSPSRATPPYDFGIWHFPLSLGLESRLRIYFKSRPAGETASLRAYHSCFDKEWSADLGFIIHKEDNRIRTRAELGSKAFSRLRHMANYGFDIERRPYVTCHATLYVDNKHAGLTFRYRPDNLQDCEGF